MTNTTYNKDTFLNLGGKMWSKDGKELRVYLNSDAILKLREGCVCATTDFEIEATKRAKTYYDIQNNKLVSDIGTVRVMLNNAGFKCVK